MGIRTRIPGELLALALFGTCAVDAQQYTISTVAGGVPPLTPAPAVDASLGGPKGVAVDPSGTLYVSGLNCVFKVNANGVMSVVAGNSRRGFSGDGGPATSAQLKSPESVTVDGNGNLYIADYGNNRVRKVSANGTITTIAGQGFPGYSGDGGPAANAQLSYPAGVAVDSGGNLYISDSGNSRVRKVSSGIITTIAGNGSFGYSGDGGPATSAQFGAIGGIAIDSGGNLYIVDSGDNRIRKVSTGGIITTVAGNGSPGFSGDGGSATSAQLYYPEGVAVDASGNIYIADAMNARIRKVSSAGIITTVAGKSSSDFSGDGGPAISAEINNPLDVAVDSSGNMYIADSGNNRVRKVSTTGIITTVAGNGNNRYSGDGGAAISAQLHGPGSVVFDSSGNFYIGDSANHRVRRVSPTGIINTVAGTGSPGYSGDGGPAMSAQLNVPYRLAIDDGGNLYIADSANYRIRKVSQAGIISTVAGNGSFGYSGDGGPATSAQFGAIGGIVVDSGGNIYIADSSNNRIRKVYASGGLITTVAGNGSDGYSGDGGPANQAQIVDPVDVTVDANSNFYILDNGNYRIRKVSRGIITTVAGNGSQGYSGDDGPATSAEIDGPRGIALDTNGNLFVADTRNNRIRRISATGTITTVAGNGSEGYSGDGGPAVSAQLYNLMGVAVDAGGNVYVADYYNDAVRLLKPTSSACTYSVSFTTLQSPAAGGSFLLTITTGSGCAWTIANLPDWIGILGQAVGSGSAQITVVVAANPAVPRSAQILAAGIAVTVNQSSSLLSVSAGGVVNGASYTPRVAPGSIASIFGNYLLSDPISLSGFPLPTNLGGLSFQFSGAPFIPLFYAAPGQANGQVPWELAGQSPVTIIAAMNAQVTIPQTVTLATYAPGLFATNGAGTGQGAILDSGYRLVDSTNPATAGNTVVQIFCTGLGPVSNQPATGAGAPSRPLALTTTQPVVSVGGETATVSFSGLTPGFAGLYQVNAAVPEASAKGNAVPVALSIGGVVSNTVTIAVK